MNELIEQIILNKELTDDQKITLINKVVNASHNKERFLTEGFYLHAVENQETNTIDIQLWYRNMDPDSGMTHHGNTNSSKEQILEFMKKTCITNGRSRR